ncbi:MAG: hypothetical protein ACE5JU_17985, partial [Candidatus Binatia bacterium]
PAQLIFPLDAMRPSFLGLSYHEICKREIPALSPCHTACWRVEVLTGKRGGSQQYAFVLKD